MATDLYEISGLCVDVEYMVMGVLANNVYIVSDGEGTMVVDPSCPVDRTVAHGDVVEVGNMKWKVIETPGHTPGSICLFDIPQFGNHPKGLPVLISGDTLFAGTIGRTDFEGGSMADMRASLKKLAALPDDTAVLPGHNNLTTIGAERRRVFALYGDPE